MKTRFPPQGHRLTSHLMLTSGGLSPYMSRRNIPEILKHWRNEKDGCVSLLHFFQIHLFSNSCFCFYESAPFLLICVGCFFYNSLPQRQELRQFYVCVVCYVNCLFFSFFTSVVADSPHITRTLHWVTAAVTKAQWGQQVESTDWVGKTIKEK